MATFSTLRDELRGRKIVEVSEDFYGDAMLLTMLVDASREIAGAMRFPRKTISNIVTAGTVSFSAPSGVRDVVSVSYGGVSLQPVSFQYVTFLQQLVSESWPRGWNWDAGRGGDIQVGPPAAAGTFTTLYIGDPYASTPTASTSVWDGLYEDFHELVLLRASVKAMEMGFEFSDAEWYAARYQSRLAEFGQFLGLPTQSGGSS